MADKVFLSPSKYVQGNGVLERCAPYFMNDLGKRYLMLSGPRSFKHAGNRLKQTLEEAGAEVTYVPFNGQSSLVEIERICKIIEDSRFDTVIAVGGGKVQDTARGVKANLRLNLAVVPTVASTDAPVASLYAIYSEDDEVQEYRFTRNADLVLVDTAVIAKAPAEYLAYGIADALATWLEAKACTQSHSTTTTGGYATIAGLAIAEKCEEIIFENGIQAYEANKAHVVTKALECVVEANTLLSGIGYESGGLAAAHAIHNGFTALRGEIEKKSHGEKVAYGTLTQLFLENQPRPVLDKYISFYRKLGLPVTLKELGLEGVSQEDLFKVAESATSAGETIHNMPFAVTAEDVVAAIVAADRYVTTYFG